MLLTKVKRVFLFFALPKSFKLKVDCIKEGVHFLPQLSKQQITLEFINGEELYMLL